MPVLERERFDAGEMPDHRVVDQHVDGSHPRTRRFDERIDAFDRRQISTNVTHTYVV
jgi:hypothetical protein